MNHIAPDAEPGTDTWLPGMSQLNHPWQNLVPNALNVPLIIGTCWSASEKVKVMAQTASIFEDQLNPSSQVTSDYRIAARKTTLLPDNRQTPSIL